MAKTKRVKLQVIRQYLSDNETWVEEGQIFTVPFNVNFSMEGKSVDITPEFLIKVLEID